MSKFLFSQFEFVLSPFSRVALLSVLFCMTGIIKNYAQITITGFGTVLSEDFGTLASTGTSSTVPAGWAFLEIGSNANTIYTAGTGSATTGETYSFGAAGSAERAFGGLQSGSLNPTIGVSFTNNTSDTIESLNITYSGEQWRLGALGRVDRLDFQYSLNATSLNTGTWTDYDALDFIAPVTTGTAGALNGNVAPNRTLITSTITGLLISNGSTFWLRWNDFNPAGSDDGLAVDDFSLIACSTPDLCDILPIGLLKFTVGNSGHFSQLNWQTWHEIDNDYFEIQRSNGADLFATIGMVNGGGNTNTISAYQFVDQSPLNGVNYYRLKQYDLNGNFSYSPARKIMFKGQPLVVSLSPNPATEFIKIEIQTEESQSLIRIMDVTGRIVHTENIHVENQLSQINIDNLNAGTYLLWVESGSNNFVERFVIF